MTQQTKEKILKKYVSYEVKSCILRTTLLVYLLEKLQNLIVRVVERIYTLKSILVVVQFGKKFQFL